MTVRWSIGTDVLQVHALIEASDRAAAARSGTAAPARRTSSTEALVRARAVRIGHVARW